MKMFVAGGYRDYPARVQTTEIRSSRTARIITEGLAAI